MTQQAIYNEDGELIGTEYVRDSFEEQEAEWEEEMLRAEDPLYAASQENAAWLAKAHLAFEMQGIEVPYDIEKRLAQEMRKKAARLKEESQLEKAKPLVLLFNNMIEGCGAYAIHVPETPDEIAYTYISFKNKVTKNDVSKVCAMADEKGIDYSWIDIDI